MIKKINKNWIKNERKLNYISLLMLVFIGFTKTFAYLEMS